MKNRLFPKTCEKNPILNPFWEAKILDFRIFFDVFWKQILNKVLEAKKIEKNCSKPQDHAILGRPCGMCGLLGREKERGQKPLEQEFLEEGLG